MQKYAGTIITWLICQQAIQEQDRELYTYALYNMVLLIIPFMMLRKFSGGFHAKTPLRCMAISSFYCFCVLKLFLSYLATGNY